MPWKTPRESRRPWKLRFANTRTSGCGSTVGGKRALPASLEFTETLFFSSLLLKLSRRPRNGDGIRVRVGDRLSEQFGDGGVETRQNPALRRRLAKQLCLARQKP